jgi:hypothetical protein
MYIPHPSLFSGDILLWLSSYISEDSFPPKARFFVIVGTVNHQNRFFGRLSHRALPLLFIYSFLLITLQACAPPMDALSQAGELSPASYLPLVQGPEISPVVPTTFIPTGATWTYLDDGSDQGISWREPFFDDSAWKQGAAELGYGDGDENTVIGFGADPNNKYITTYFRRTFTVTQPADFALLDFHLLRDDGAVVYLNGQEVIRSNLPSGPLTFQTLAPQTMGVVGEVMWHPHAVSANWLVPGENVVAVEVHQNTLNSSDVSFALSLTGLPPTFEAMIEFAAIGDYGKNNGAEGAVANLVKSWLPDFVITLGDNNYPVGAQGTLDENVDAYYGEFIEDTFETTRFFPSLGNHDWGDGHVQSITCTGSDCDGPYLDHFDLPGNERYYDYVKGPVHFFVLDSDPHEPDGISISSLQAAWLQNALATAPEPWKVVYFHHPPYSSGDHGNTSALQWPFKAWGADVVLSGHDHNYERLGVDEFPYFVNGAGGALLRPCGDPISGSALCYADDYGAMHITADYCHMNLTFVTATNVEIDTIFLDNGHCP